MLGIIRSFFGRNTFRLYGRTTSKHRDIGKVLSRRASGVILLGIYNRIEAGHRLFRHEILVEQSSALDITDNGPLGGYNEPCSSRVPSYSFLLIGVIPCFSGFFDSFAVHDRDFHPHFPPEYWFTPRSPLLGSKSTPSQQFGRSLMVGGHACMLFCDVHRAEPSETQITRPSSLDPLV